MGMIHEALEWLGAHPEALADIEPVSYDWREIGEAIGMLGEMSDDTVDYIGKMPEVMRNLLISVLASGSRGDATVRTSWTPSYDWTMTISKANFGEGPEYHVALGSKYPPEVMGLD